MTYVINEACIDVKDGDCTNVCPVDCIYEGGRMFYIQPDECVNCAVCVSVCPVEAIFAEEDLPPESTPFRAVNAEFFGDRVTGWGSPGGLSPAYRTESDHPVVAGWDSGAGAEPTLVRKEGVLVHHGTSRTALDAGEFVRAERNARQARTTRNPR